MCGLGGIFHFSGAVPAVERATLERLGDATRHRGPDGFGTWMSPEGRLGLVVSERQGTQTKCLKPPHGRMPW